MIVEKVVLNVHSCHPPVFATGSEHSKGSQLRPVVNVGRVAVVSKRCKNMQYHLFNYHKSRSVYTSMYILYLHTVFIQIQKFLKWSQSVSIVHGFEMLQSSDQELRQELQQPEAGGVPVVSRALGSSQQSLDTSPGQTITWCQCRAALTILQWGV